MNWKTYNRDILMFAEEGDENEDEQPSGGGDEDNEESDVDKLRSSYDAKLAQLNKEIEQLKSKGADDYQSIADKEFSAADAYVKSVLATLESEKDPAKALSFARQVIQQDIGSRYSQSYAAVKVADAKLRNAQAESYAAQLSQEYGGSTASHKATLLESKSESDMRAKFLELQLTLTKEKKPKGKASDEPRPRIDRGGGGAARANVLSEMLDIDISTPEGQKQWRENESKFKRKLQPTR